MQRILFLLFFHFAFVAFSQQKKDSSILVSHTYFLSSPQNEGRLTGSKGELLAAEYLQEKLEEMGVQPLSCSFIRPFKFKQENTSISGVQADTLNGLNVVGFIDNKQEKTILIGAHFDHLGRNEFGSGRHPEKTGEIHFGADDNASGVAAILELANKITSNKRTHKANYIVAFFSGEELGLQGAKVLVHELKQMEIPIHFMLNFDMVGRLNSERNLIFEGVGSGNVFDSTIHEINTTYQLNPTINLSGVGASDYTPFYLDSIPVLGITTGVHSDYHTIFDTPDKLNYSGMLTIIDFSYDLLNAFESSEIIYMETAIPSTRSRSSLKVSLGIMPGYGEGGGLLIEAVMDDKPAKLAGLVRGDKIIQINDCSINSIHDYMDCLSNYEKGDTVTIHFIRNNEKNKVNLTF